MCAPQALALAKMEVSSHTPSTTTATALTRPGNPESAATEVATTAIDAAMSPLARKAWHASASLEQVADLDGDRI